MSTAFLAQLNRLPWFAQVGQPSPRDSDVLRIYAWETWLGPEEPGATVQAHYHMKWYKQLFGSDTPPDDHPLIPLWEQIRTQVFALARANVPYDDDEDVWYGPNAAVITASWVAALVGCTITTFGQLPPPDRPRSQWSLASEWWWYQTGHWPCAYYWTWGHMNLGAVERMDIPHRLIVY